MDQKQRYRSAVSLALIELLIAGTLISGVVFRKNEPVAEQPPVETPPVETPSVETSPVETSMALPEEQSQEDVIKTVMEQLEWQKTVDKTL